MLVISIVIFMIPMNIVLLGNWTPQPTSVWDIEPPKSQAQSFEEIQRIEIERQRRVSHFITFFAGI